MLDSWAKKKVQILLISTPSIRPTGLFISASSHVLSSKLFPIVWRHTTNLHWFFLLVFHRNPMYFLSGLLQFKNEHSLLLLRHNPCYRIIVYIIFDAISVTTKNYLPYCASNKKSIICKIWASNSDWLKRYLSFMSKGGTAWPK